MISTFAELKSALEDWMIGQAVTSQLETFIALACAECSRKLRTAEMIARSTAEIDTAYVPLPGGFLEARNVTAGGNALRQISLDAADHERERLVGGSPQFYAISGGEMEIIPAPSGPVTVEIVFYRAIPALSDDNQTNWLLTRAPDLLLNCALAHAAPYLANPQSFALHRAETDRILEEVRFADLGSQHGGSPLTIRTRRAF